MEKKDVKKRTSRKKGATKRTVKVFNQDCTVEGDDEGGVPSEGEKRQPKKAPVKRAVRGAELSAEKPVSVNEARSAPTKTEEKKEKLSGGGAVQVVADSVEKVVDDFVGQVNNLARGAGKRLTSAEKPHQRSSKEKRGGSGEKEAAHARHAPTVGVVRGSEHTIERCVDDFVNQINTLGVDGMKKQFAELKNYVPPNFKFETFTANPAKNRYVDVVCLEETRVKLTVENPGDSEYIHANWVKLDRHDRTYIATQGPIDDTIADFWRMCWEFDVYCIVMLCRTVEEGKQRCSQYWPEKLGDFKTYGKIFVNNKKTEVDKKSQTCVLEILPEGCSNSKIVTLLQYTYWPDGGAPVSGTSILRLLRQVTMQDRLATGSVVMHCSAGIGRTGTIILIDWIITRIFSGIPIDMADLFKKLRNQRVHSIQTEAQWVFVYAAVLDYVKVKLKLPRFQEAHERLLEQMKKTPEMKAKTVQGD